MIFPEKQAKTCLIFQRNDAFLLSKLLKIFRFSGSESKLHTVAQNLENAGKQGNLARNSTKLKDKLLGGYKNVLLIEEARKICVLARF